MPRAKARLSVEDLRAILRGELPEGKLKEWALSEIDRREKAGRTGGRPKKVEKLNLSNRVEDFDFGA